MRRLLKGILLIVLLSVLIATPVLAWIVYENGIADVSLTIKRAEAEWEEVEIEIRPVNSGANFHERGSTELTIENAETLYVTFEVITLTEEEMAALDFLEVTIGEDTDEDGEINTVWGTIGDLPLPIPMPPYPLSEGHYNVIIEVAGVAGYPKVETPITFAVRGTCSSLPVPIP